MNEYPPSGSFPPEGVPAETIQLREEVLARTLAPLHAAEQTAREMANRAITSAVTERARAIRPGNLFDGKSYMDTAAAHTVDAEILRARAQEVTRRIEGASHSELSERGREFDPYKARYVAATTDKLMTGTAINNPAKFERYMRRIAIIAAAEYDQNPIRPSPDFTARRSAELRSKGLVSWAINSLIDRI